MLVEFLGDRDVGVGQTPSGLATTTGHGLGAANAVDLRGLAVEGLGLEVSRKLLAREATPPIQRLRPARRWLIQADGLPIPQRRQRLEVEDAQFGGIFV